MDPIKEAFMKIKQDIDTLKDEIQSIKTTLSQLSLQTTPTHLSSNITPQTNNQTDIQTQNVKNNPLEAPYLLNSVISIGNDGVPTDKQTNKQTNQHPIISYGNEVKEEAPNDVTPFYDFKRASDILQSLDDVKKEIRHKFKRLTPQEMVIFSTLYALEEQHIEETTYRTIAKILSLSESSIREYINKLIKKGIPIDKIRQNNKTIMLKISPNLKNITTLETIKKLREI